MGIKNWKLYTCYRPLYYKEKNIFSQILGYWLIAGDLNKLLNDNEKFRGQNIVEKHLFLKDFLVRVVGVDLGYSSHWYIWESK